MINSNNYLICFIYLIIFVTYYYDTHKNFISFDRKQFLWFSFIEGGGYATNDRRYKLLLQDNDDLQNILGQPTSALFDSSEDERYSLSDDSGHSSDTDIDAIVAEYKEKVKVCSIITSISLIYSLRTGVIKLVDC